ncbi:AAA family ATPase [Chitinophaga sp. SYP-B3965]|uniref:AAA family ATPase n=1 Tax=Chitinophaga sp. SYP-B3965 TaxID=2663120 RepID=UPI001299A655|nr:AAA family ATPase [Chitinophaga sp. SYP-B3965]MRG45346.1 AAA family ATPase [Chitinophaga sp. SYP-B3965]
MSFTGMFQIPNELLIKKRIEDDIAKRYIASYTQVIAIANTIHDKFKVKNKRFFSLKASEGKSIIRKALIQCLAMVARDDMKRLGTIGNTLFYIGYWKLIGFKLRGLKYNAIDIIAQSDLSPQIKEEITYCLENYKRQFQYQYSTARIIVDDRSFQAIKDSYLLTLFKYESELRKYKVISYVDFFLYREKETIPLNGASSGELTLISTLLFITSIISYDSVILIDEPENSLHPKWQMEYVKHMNELFYLYQPKIIIATHSPLIINGADLLSKTIQIYKGVKGEFKLQVNETNNVEEIYQDYFDVTTPENRYLSELVVQKMNELADGGITLIEFEKTINELNSNSYDDKQKEVLDGIIEMGRKIKNV